MAIDPDLDDEVAQPDDEQIPQFGDDRPPQFGNTDDNANRDFAAVEPDVDEAASSVNSSPPPSGVRSFATAAHHFRDGAETISAPVAISEGPCGPRHGI